MPGFIEPMLSTLTISFPGATIGSRSQMGRVRGLVYIDDGSVAIYTRNNNRCERQYPELQVLPHYIKAKQAILDGEIVVMNERGFRTSN